jgi:threonine/homoserine/homoserine lactone efflux protein
MFGIHDLSLFILAGFLLNITPGPDMLYVIGRSASQGRRAGFVAALGIGAGCFVHIFAAAIGLSALLLASATAFAVLKIIGAAYLCYVGLSMLFTTRTRLTSNKTIAPAPLVSVFMQGFLTNALNPKVALFFLAFLPQFIGADADNKALALLVLGTLFNITGTLWNAFVAWGAASVSTRVHNSMIILWMNRAIGTLFVALGLRLALASGNGDIPYFSPER